MNATHFLFVLSIPTNKHPLFIYLFFDFWIFFFRFAYLDFPSSVEVTIAVGLSEQHLDGRKLLIKSSTDFTGRPSGIAPLPLPSTLDPSSLTSSNVTTMGGAVAEGPNQTLNKTARKILDRQRNQPGPTLFIGNLGFETEVEDIRGMFDAHQRAAGAWAPKIKVIEKEDGKMEVELEEVKDLVEGEVDEDRDEDGSDDSDEEESEKEEEVESAGSEEDEEKEVKKVKKVRSKVEKGPKDLSKANDAGIRKIRLGTFEDTGKCKGLVKLFPDLYSQILTLEYEQMGFRRFPYVRTMYSSSTQ